MKANLASDMNCKQVHNSHFRQEDCRLCGVFLDMIITSATRFQLATPSYVQRRPLGTPASSNMHVVESAKAKRTPSLSKGGGATKTGKTPVSFI